MLVRPLMLLVSAFLAANEVRENGLCENKVMASTPWRDDLDIDDLN